MDKASNLCLNELIRLVEKYQHAEDEETKLLLWPLMATIHVCATDKAAAQQWAVEALRTLKKHGGKAVQKTLKS